MYRSLILSNFDDRARNDNHLRLPQSLEDLGLNVVRADHDSLMFDSTQLTCKDSQGFVHLVNEFDLIWVLGFGDRLTFLDRMQLLQRVEETRFVNSIDALVYRHGKAGLLTPKLNKFQPTTYVSNQSELLYQKMTTNRDWIVKPNAGSFGSSVFVIRKRDLNAHVILETICESGYALLQERVDTGHEKRILIVAGKIIGALGKTSTSIRKNRATGATFVKTSLSDQETEFLSKISEILQSERIQFAALDIAFPYLLDVNFVNPGWLQTYAEVNGEDLTPGVIRTLIEYFGFILAP